jgi:hypothetical protein
MLTLDSINRGTRPVMAAIYRTQSGKLLLTPQDYITQVLYFFNQFACIYDWSIGAGARDSVAGYNFCRVWC